MVSYFKTLVSFIIIGVILLKMIDGAIENITYHVTYIPDLTQLDIKVIEIRDEKRSKKVFHKGTLNP